MSTCLLLTLLRILTTSMPLTMPSPCHITATHTPKQVTELETKLRTAVQEKQQALAEKGAAERQLKQQGAKALALEKNMEKAEAVEAKRRESMMVRAAMRCALRVCAACDVLCVCLESLAFDVRLVVCS